MGTLNMSIQSGQPVFLLGISSNKSFDYTPEAATRGAAYDRTMRPPTRTGLEVGQRSWSISAMMVGPIPVLLGEYGFVFPELGVQLKSSLRLSVRKYGAGFAAFWTAKSRNTTDNANSVGAEVEIGSDGVSLSLE
ncbi:hypothetical protein PHLCEN_2v7361 [Hermanssonia centrifuga]|uniref:Uncharacterized protein n=1 Tax=Hermanssonia centrifuga TaxID=98765 RepID=A0A2R6NWS1_9APHY|nr:hypothetical protein PHLCEN_2v7361 [Hermanssonia centrifuga]